MNRRRPAPRGFTLIEILVVIVILVILIGLLLPAIMAAVRTARNAAVSAEINNLAQALADFKSKYGDYPPSRIVLTENGTFDTTNTTNMAALPAGWWYGNAPPIAGTNGLYGNDITFGQLAQRTLRYMRKFWPRVTFSATSVAPAGINANPGGYYDFNGNGLPDTQAHILLEGHECLAFFLGGIPNVTQNSNGTPIRSMSGFGKAPTNPFVNNAFTTNRTSPFFEFRSDRLIDSDGDSMPGYADSLDTSSDLREYAYFNSYGNGSYDPNDVNAFEQNLNAGGGFVGRAFLVNFQVPVQLQGLNVIGSPAPNPYTNSPPIPVTGATPTIVYQNPESFQIISSGRDRNYGVGGQYISNVSGERLPITDAGAAYHSGANLDPSVRQSENDNLTNFSTSTLQ